MASRLRIERGCRLVREDYRRFHDYGKILKYVTYGKKEDNLYINVGQRYAHRLKQRRMPGYEIARMLQIDPLWVQTSLGRKMITSSTRFRNSGLNA